MVIVAGNEETKKIKGLYLYHFGVSTTSQKVSLKTSMTSQVTIGA